jgi:hypothetical protein
MTSRPPLGAHVRGANAWILWQAARDVLLSRLGQLERDPAVHAGVVRGFRATLDDLELAAVEFRDWERSRRSAADSAEVTGRAFGAESDSPPTGLDAGTVAEVLGCTERWVTQLCLTGRLAATKRGRMWSIDPESVEDFKKGIAA